MTALGCAIVINHYERVWKNRARKRHWSRGPLEELPAGFCILEFPPKGKRNLWTYATCCMSSGGDENRIELHLFSPIQAEQLVELLTAVGHYHHNGARLDVGHTVNFGRPWLPGSLCSYGLISRPYLDGPNLEMLELTGNERVRFLWLIPITAGEVRFKQERGLQALEDLFEASNISYADPLRPDLAVTH